MIKYYSTLEDKFYDCEKAAQEAEDNYVENYFKDMDLRLAAKRRKIHNIIDNQYDDSISFKIKIS